MRARTVKPDFFLNEDLAELGPHAMLLFAGLWCAADREGRLEDRPAKLKVQVLPYFDCDTDELLTTLEQAGFIQRYGFDNRKYLQIINFSRHQKPHPKEPESTIPAAPKTARSGAGRTKTRSGSDPVAAGSDPHQIQPDLGVQAKEGIEGKEDPDRKRSDLDPENDRLLDRFDHFWKTYPRHCAKEDARRAWLKLRPSADLLVQIIEAVTKRRTEGDWAGKDLDKLPYPATYLNGKRWNDEFVPASGNLFANAPPRPRYSRGMDNLASEFEAARNGVHRDNPAFDLGQRQLVQTTDGPADDPDLAPNPRRAAAG